jgi:hypothetical protein
MRQTNRNRVRWVAVLVPVAVSLGVLVWWRSRGDEPAPPEMIDLVVGPGGVVTLHALEGSLSGGRDRLENPAQVQSYLRRVYEDRMRLVPPEERHNGPPVRFVIRADEGAKPADVDAVRGLCERAGFRDTEVRARER